MLLLGDGPGVPNMSLAPVQPQTCTGATAGVALEQETFSGLSGHPPKRLLSPSPIPKGPRRTKNTTRSKFTTRSLFSTAG